jgi:hypothetical protein
MKYIVTRKNADGTFDEVGMNNRFVDSRYASLRTLLRYGVPAAWRTAGIRVEVFQSERFYGSPVSTHFF